MKKGRIEKEGEENKTRLRRVEMFTQKKREILLDITKRVRILGKKP